MFHYLILQSFLTELTFSFQIQGEILLIMNIFFRYRFPFFYQ